MVDKRIILVLFLIVCSVFVSSEPFRDVYVDVVDPSGVGVENVNVSMFLGDSDWFSYSGLTNSSGELLFVVDVHIWEKVNYSNEQMVMSAGPDDVPDDVPDEDETASKDSSGKGYPNTVVNLWVKNFSFHLEQGPDCVYDFVAIDEFREFSLRHEPINLEFEVYSGVPVINLPPTLEVNEEDNHSIILDLEDYITDYDNPFNELEITIKDISWNTIESDIEIVDGELIVDFLPEISLDYHQSNDVTFTIKVNDSSNVVEETYTYYYAPDYKAILASDVFDIYNDVIVTGFDVKTLNGYDQGTRIEGNKFITFYNLSIDPELNITHPDYYNSVRHINHEDPEDLAMNFGLIETLYDPDYEGDYREDGFTRVFRAGGSNPLFMHTRWLNETIWCIHDQGNYGYDPGPADFVKVNTSLSFVYNFTNGFMNPFDGSHLIVDDTGFCDPGTNHEYGYTTMRWDTSLPSHGAHGETFASNGVTILRASIAIKDGNVDQGTYNQEFLQTLGATRDIDWAFINLFGDYWPPGESTFCDEIPNCEVPFVPTDLDILWGVRAYQRYLSIRPDLDAEAIYKNSKNAYTEVRHYYKKEINGNDIFYYKLKGYAPANQHIKKDDIIKELPKKSQLIKYDDGSIRIKQKSNNEERITKEQKNKIQKLLPQQSQESLI